MTDWRKQLLDNVEQRKQKNITDTLKAKRTYAEEVQKSSPGYKATKAKETEAKKIKADTNLKKAKKEAKGPTPQEDILRFGKKRQEFRNLAYKTSLVQRTDDDDVKEFDSSGKPIKDLVITELPGNEIFKQQVEAYGDSLKLASLAQQSGRKTSDVRKIDRGRDAITQERNDLTKKLMSQEFPLVPGPDGTYTRISDEEKMKASMERANDMLVQKYGKGIIPLLTALANR